MSVCTHMCSRGLLSLPGSRVCIQELFLATSDPVLFKAGGHAWLEATLTSLPLSVPHLCAAPLRQNVLYPTPSYLGINHCGEEGPKVLCRLGTREGAMRPCRPKTKGVPSPQPTPHAQSLKESTLPQRARESCSQSHQPPAGRSRGATHVAHFDPAVLLQQPPFDLWPQRLGNIEA